MRAVTGIERVFDPAELIVSKTDPRGRITYANDVFQRVSGYRSAELLGQPHNIVRHPQMPRGVFRFMWQQLQQGEEVFAYVINLTKWGDHYWVFAHVTPSFDSRRVLRGYHSSRRTPNRAALPAILQLYGELQAEEARHRTPPEAAAASQALFEARLGARGISCSQFMFELDGLKAAA